MPEYQNTGEKQFQFQCHRTSSKFNNHKELSVFAVVIVILFITTHKPCTCAILISDDRLNNNASLRLSNHSVLIVISYDGFRYDFSELTDTPNMDEVGYSGVKTIMKNQFPTKTFPNHQSIATGLHPESHGIIENSCFDPKFNETLGSGREEFWAYRDDVVPIWVLNEWAGDNRSSGVLMWPGCEFPYGSNKTKPTFHQTYDTNIPFETRMDTIISWITHESRPANLVLAHLEEPDSTSHAWGPNSTQTMVVIQRMDNVTGYLIGRLKQLGIYDKVNLMLLSDHGFHAVSTKGIINITSLVDPALYKKYGKSPVINIDPINVGDTELIYHLFNNASIGQQFKIYRKSEINTLKPHWFFQHSRRIRPLILVAEPGFVFDDFMDDITNYYSQPPYNHPYGENETFGTHGYDNHDMSMHPFFRAHGPLFHADRRDVSSFTNIDLFPLFCHICGFGPPNNNGTRDAIRLLLIHEKQFHLGATTVGWIVVIAVIFGLLILTVILSFLRQSSSSRKLHSHSLLTNSTKTTGYRFINNKRRGDYEDDDYDEDQSETKVLVHDYEDNNSDDEDEGGGVMSMRDIEDREAVNLAGVMKNSQLQEGAGADAEHVHLDGVIVIGQEPGPENGNSKRNRNGSFIPLVNMLDDEDVEEFRVPVTAIGIGTRKNSKKGYRVKFA